MNMNKMKDEKDKNKENRIMKDENDKNKINKMKDENDKNTTNEMKHENDKNEMNNMNHQKDKNKKNRMKDEKDKNDCITNKNIATIKKRHPRWWSHLDQHHHHYLLLLSCLEHLFVSLTLFQRTLIILTSFTFISTLAWPEASVAMKVKSINTNSVSDTSNDENNCLNKQMKKMKDMKVATMNLAQMKKNEPTVRELKKNSVVVDNWSLLCYCLAQAIQIFMTLWSAWLTYTVDSRWWPLVTCISVSKYYIHISYTVYSIQDYHNL